MTNTLDLRLKQKILKEELMSIKHTTIQKLYTEYSEWRTIALNLLQDSLDPDFFATLDMQPALFCPVDGAFNTCDVKQGFVIHLPDYCTIHIVISGCKEFRDGAVLKFRLVRLYAQSLDRKSVEYTFYDYHDQTRCTTEEYVAKETYRFKEMLAATFVTTIDVLPL